MAETRQAWRLRKRPEGAIGADDLELLEEPMPQIGDGELLVKVKYISMDPTNRIWMSDMEQYMPPVEIGDVMRAGVAGEIIASKHPDYSPGMHVGGLGGYATYIAGHAANFQPLPDIPGLELSQIFGSLGGTAMTAYFGFLDICAPKAGETLLVSAASGAVGSMVGQIAKIKGCRVIGIAGGREKCDYVVNELGFDGCIDYKNEDVAAKLDQLCPDGIDMNFENVGGEIMDAVMARMNDFGRMSLCGMISTYNDTEDMPGPHSWPLILMRRLKVQGFIVSDYMERFPEAAQQVMGWMMEGKIKTKEDIRHGIENAINVLNDLYSGGNFGKLLLQLD